MKISLASLVLLALPMFSGAQATAATRPGRRPLLPAPREIALARSAAPRDVSRDATIYVLTDTGYAVAVPGTNGNACLVDRSWPESLEPECFDPEAAATVMQSTLAQMAGIQQGRDPAAIDRELAEGLRSGRLRLPTRPAMVYMMSSAQRLVGDNGRPAGNWQPHLMLHIPYLTNAQLGRGSRPDPEAGMVVNEGTPLAQFLVVVKRFVDPEEAPAGRP